MAVAPLQIAPQVKAPSVSAGMDKLSGNLQAAYQASYNFGRMNPDVVQQALAQGGSLSNALGFSNAGQVMGLSPQELMALTQGQGSMQQIQQAGQVFDLISGGKETRDAMRNMADRTYQGGVTGLTTDAANQLTADTSNANRQQQAYDTIYHGDITQNEGALNRDNQMQTTRMHIQSQEKIAAESKATQLAIAKMHNDLEARRLKYTQDLMRLSASGAAPSGTTPDASMATQYNIQLKGYGALEKDGTGFNLGKVPDTYKPQAVQSYMQREAAKGLPYRTKYNIPKGMQQYVGGYSQLILGKDGWHGIYAGKIPGQNTQLFVTDSPIVPYSEKAPTNKAAQMANGGAVGMPAYSPE